MWDTPEKRKSFTKWVIGTFTLCVLIYLGIGHVADIARAISGLFEVLQPLLIGALLALMLNVPMDFWERVLRRHTRLGKSVRPLSILLALICVCGIFAGIALLVLPELMEALRMVVQIVGGTLSRLSQMENDPALYDEPLERFLAGLNIDWLALKTQLEAWIRARSGAAMEQLVALAKMLVNSIVTLFLALVFAIYLLSGKEKFKRQAKRLLHAWLPAGVGNPLMHIWHVCSSVFRRFVVGQTTEAVILGSLCMAGMFLLRLPYAPMVGALVGVTALIPIVGAFVGTIVGAIMILPTSPFKALVFVVYLLILQQVEGNLIYPRVVGSKIQLPAIWVLASVTVGGSLGGPLGMLLGVPAASAGYALIREATEHREQQIPARGAPARENR